MKTSNEIFCFAKGTKILVPSGERNIELIKPGETIFSFNIQSNSIETVTVNIVVSSFHSLINEITFSNGVSIRSTLDHPYWVIGKGWSAVNNRESVNKFGIKIGELEVNDTCLYLRNGRFNTIKIVNITTHFGDFEMHDISGGDHHSFFANGVLVFDENLIFATKMNSGQSSNFIMREDMH